MANRKKNAPETRGVFLIRLKTICLVKQVTDTKLHLPA